MTDKTKAQKTIPVLTDIVKNSTPVDVADREQAADNASLIAELQTRLAASAYALTEEALHSAFAEMEATLFEQISRRLRQELPELIDRVLREQLGREPDES